MMGSNNSIMHSNPNRSFPFTNNQGGRNLQDLQNAMKEQDTWIKKMEQLLDEIIWIFHQKE